MIKPELFDDAIGELPASTVDVRAIIARQERKKAVRRGSAGALGATGLVLAFSVVPVLGLKGQPHTVQPSVGPGLVSPSAAVAESAEAKAARVQAAWMRATARVLPQATWRAGHDGSFETPSRADYFDEVGGPTPPPMSTRTNSVNGEMLRDANGRPEMDRAKWPIGDFLYHSFGIVKVGTNEGRFMVRTVWRESPNNPNSACSTKSDGVLTCGDDLICFAGAECERSTGPNGEVVFATLQPEQIPGYRLPYKRLWVWVRSADGTRTIEMTIENRAGSDGGPGPVTTELALTKEQVISLLLEPGLMI